jgi:hypothetical protein
MDREEMIARIQKEEDPLELSIEAWEDKTSVGICPNTLYKWGEFKLDISNTLQCCDEMKSSDSKN